MNHRNRSRVSLAILAVLVSQWACQTLLPSPTATVAPTSSVTPTAALATELPAIETALPLASPTFSEEEIRAGIQASLDQYAQAYRENDPERLEQVVDQENKPFRRIVRSRFDDFQGSYLGGQIDLRMQLLDITQHEHGFVLARFQTDSGLEGQWPFRYLNGTWVLSEPTVEQIGEPVTTESEHFVFKTYPWADDVNPLIMEMMESARQSVGEVLGIVPEEKPNVEIMPIYGLRPFESMGAIASYSQGPDPSRDRIQIYTPDSFAFSYYDPSVGWEQELERILVHEYTHLAHARSFENAGRLSDWMSEGLAEYVSGADQNSYWACDAMESGTLIPIIDESREINQQDLMHMYLLEENFALSYDFATSLVEYTVENHGGLEGFWRLANALDDTSNFKRAVPEAFGISYEEYNSEWQAWLGEQC
jgi:NurA-like 5'-3' nuclease